MFSTDPLAFAQSWLDAWNSHDIDAVLAHFSDDATFSSPVARELLGESGGVLHGKAAIRGYWEEGLRRIPDLRFELVDVYAGVDVIVINFRNQRGGLVCEVLVFENDHRSDRHRALVVSGHGTYRETGDSVDNPAGTTRA
ncbi:nuclear transport factor 2 family protein [Leifsonia sp. NPDC058230]|uniref:nuclear transport factor 2 family protein n=1 Tax=Leifsonia sp. NPDC058230 TaxID=3346391 RepID=UPI0036DF51A5